jgi:uncharacterized LabA/DUF88 family protein
MAERTFVYVDGESHFIRSEHEWRTLHGEEACLDDLRCLGQADDRMVLVIPKAKVFWTRRMNPGVRRATYFTSAAGDEPFLHNIRVTLRNFDLEPDVMLERSHLAAKRQNVLQKQQLIEKPKGVDIALAVRMLEDAHRRIYDVCHLYTSDVDFVPVIKAVMACGIQVCVHGYKNGLSQQSDLLHVPDLFTDLAEMLQNECELARSK